MNDCFEEHWRVISFVYNLTPSLHFLSIHSRAFGEAAHSAPFFLARLQLVAFSAHWLQLWGEKHKIQEGDLRPDHLAPSIHQFLAEYTNISSFIPNLLEFLDYFYFPVGNILPEDGCWNLLVYLNIIFFFKMCKSCASQNILCLRIWL